MTAKSVLKFAADEKAAYVNVRFTDLVGAWHHLTFPIEELTEKVFEEALASTVPACVDGPQSMSLTCCSCLTRRATGLMASWPRRLYV